MSLLRIIGTRTLTGMRKAKKKSLFLLFPVVYFSIRLMYDAHISIERSSDAEFSLRKHFFSSLESIVLGSLIS